MIEENAGSSAESPREIPSEELSAEEVRPQGDSGVSGPRKAAILMLSLGEELAGEVFRQLAEDEARQLVGELARLDQIPATVADEVMEEFYRKMTGREFVFTSGMDYTRRLLHQACDAENARRLLESVNHSLETSSDFAALQKADPQQLSRLFQHEHPQTTALVLAHLPPQVSAEVLRGIPAEQHTDVIQRMASLQTISNEVVRRVSVVLEQKLRNAGQENRQAIGGVQSVAGLCNRLDRDVSQNLIERLEAANPELALKIRNLMVTFEDLRKVDDTGIRELLQRVDKKLLTLALKGTTPELQSRFFSNMSSRAVEMMREEMEYLGQVKLKDVLGAQREIVEIMREMEDQGIISLNGGGENEYVS